MPRVKKDRIALNIRPDAEVMREFETYCNEVGQTKTTAFERIVSEHIKRHKAEKERIKSLESGK